VLEHHDHSGALLHLRQGKERRRRGRGKKRGEGWLGRKECGAGKKRRRRWGGTVGGEAAAAVAEHEADKRRATTTWTIKSCKCAA